MISIQGLNYHEASLLAYSLQTSWLSQFPAPPRSKSQHVMGECQSTFLTGGRDMIFLFSLTLYLYLVHTAFPSDGEIYSEISVNCVNRSKELKLIFYIFLLKQLVEVGCVSVISVVCR